MDISGEFWRVFTGFQGVSKSFGEFRGVLDIFEESQRVSGNFQIVSGRFWRILRIIREFWRFWRCLESFKGFSQAF